VEGEEPEITRPVGQVIVELDKPIGVIPTNRPDSDMELLGGDRIERQLGWVRARDAALFVRTRSDAHGSLPKCA
jgi:hypothetical protein